MKDYYRILGIGEDATQEEIKSAFRRLAFRYHPDTNPGDKKQAEEKFKEINEAYGVLGDERRRREYDFVRRGQLAGAGYEAGYGRFGYSQQDIFRDIFSNPDILDELSRMFRQAGLRFDQDFLNRVFFGGGGVVFQFFAGPGGVRRAGYQFGDRPSQPDYPWAGIPGYQPSFIERWLLRQASKMAGSLA